MPLRKVTCEKEHREQRGRRKEGKERKKENEE
jgi:hypothetical protein